MKTLQGNVVSDKSVSDDGKIAAWDVAACEWIKRWPVDIREGISMGSLIIVGQCENILLMSKGKESPIRVPDVAKKNMEAKGYKVTNKEPVKTPVEAEAEAEVEPYNFRRHSVSQLQKFAESAKIGDFTELNKNSLVEALDASDWRPPNDIS